MRRILQETPVPGIPLALSGLWDSMFSRKHPELWRRYPRRFWVKVRSSAGTPVAPGNATLARVADLRGGWR